MSSGQFLTIWVPRKTAAGSTGDACSLLAGPPLPLCRPTVCARARLGSVGTVLGENGAVEYGSLGGVCCERFPGYPVYHGKMIMHIGCGFSAADDDAVRRAQVCPGGQYKLMACFARGTAPGFCGAGAIHMQQCSQQPSLYGLQESQPMVQQQPGLYALRRSGARLSHSMARRAARRPLRHRWRIHSAAAAGIAPGTATAAEAAPWVSMAALSHIPVY